MANKLKGLEVTSVDLVEQGANQDAHVRLYKRQGVPDSDYTAPETLFQKAVGALRGAFGITSAPVVKDAKTFDEELEQERLRQVADQIWDYTYALSDSLYSILTDGELSEDGKRGMMLTSLDEFAETLRNAIPVWAAGDTADNSEITAEVAKSTAQQAALDELLVKYAYTGDDAPENTEADDTEKGCDPVTQKTYHMEETDTMKIDKSKMTPEEQATLTEFEKKYGVAEPEGTTATPTSDADTGVAKGAEPAPGNPGEADAASALHPEVKKALDENRALTEKVEALQKSLEIKDLTAMAKKYEIIGKKPEELAATLYDLKKAGDSTYDSFVALLDEQVTIVEKGGLFAELGTSRGGAAGTETEVGVKASEIRKTNTGMTTPEAIVKAFEENPELAAQYEADYNNGRV